MTTISIVTEEQVKEYHNKVDAFMSSESAEMFADSKLMATMVILEFLAHQDGCTLYTHLAPTVSSKLDKVKVETS